MPPKCLIAVAVLLVASAGGLSAQSSRRAPLPVPTVDGAALYRQDCASCHGADGRGTDRALVMFEDQVPDFTDCNFTSREPSEDWVAIAHEGGPLRGFGRMMPAFGSALTHEQFEAVVHHIKAFCRDDGWPRGELNLPRPLFTEKAYPEDEWVVETEVAGGPTASVGHTLIYEQRFGRRTQIELGFPFGYQRIDAPSGGHRWVSGVGDMTLGVKRVLSHGLESGHILSASAEVRVPTGNRADGFGAGTNGVEGFLTFAKLLPAESFLQAQAGAERELVSGAEPAVFWRGLLGRTFIPDRYGRMWSPMVEVLGAREGSEDVLWDVVPQLHVTLSRRRHVAVTFGPKIPLNGSGRPTTFQVNVLWDWFDGGLREGW